MKGTELLLTTVVVAALSVGWCGGVVGVAANDGAMPGEPASFFGEAVEVDGTEIPVGTEIVAVVNGSIEGEITVETPGEYGDSGTFDDKLRVDSSAGDEVTFHLAGPTGSVGGTTVLEAGISEENLTFPEGSIEDLDGGGSEESTESSGTTGGGTGGSTSVGGSGGGTNAGSNDEFGDDETTDSGAIDGPETVESSNGAAMPREPLFAETHEIADQFPDAPGTAVAFEETAVQEIVFENRSIGGEISIEEFVELLDGAPSLPGDRRAASVSAITVPDGLRNDDAVIRAFVSEKWLSEHGIEPASLTVYRLPDGGDRWETLPTESFEIEGGYLVEAETPGFSRFVVAGREPPSGGGEGPESPETGTGTSTDRSGPTTSEQSGDGSPEPTGTKTSAEETNFDPTSPIVPLAFLGALLVVVAAVGRLFIPRRRERW